MPNPRPTRTQTRERPPAPMKTDSEAAATSTALATNDASKQSRELRLIEALPPETIQHYSQAGYTLMRLVMVWQQCARDLDFREFLYFMERCVVTGLDPLRKQIYAIKRRDQRSPTGFTVAHQTGIDGFRAIADSSGAYAGSDIPVFLEPFVTSWGKDAHEVCHVTVWKIVQGVRVPFVGECRFSEYYPGENANGAMWRTYPHNQLAKCTEAQALRKAFPVQLGEFEMAGEIGGGSNDDRGAFIDALADRATARADNVRQLDQGDSQANAAEYERLYGDGSNDGSTTPTSDVSIDPPRGDVIDADVRELPQIPEATIGDDQASGTSMQDDDTPPWEEGLVQSAPTPVASSEGSAGAERAAQGLCTHPECVEANTPNKAAAETNPPRCLNHVG